MHSPRLSIIAAIGRNRVIGKNGKLLWNIPEDMCRFRQYTAGHPVIMGRKTFESIGRALPNRTNIVVSRNASFQASGIIVAASLEKALEEAKRVESSEIFVIGGGEIYRQALPFTDRLYLTLVDDSSVGDTYFPDYSSFTRVIGREEREYRGLKYSFLILEK